MSRLARMLLAADVEGTTVSGSLTGSGSLSIPAGVTSITLTGNGGPGTAGTSATYSTASSIAVNPSGSTVSPTSVTALSPGNVPIQSGSWPAASSIDLYTPYGPGESNSQNEFIQDGPSLFSYRRLSAGSEAAVGQVYVQATFIVSHGANGTPASAGQDTTASIQSQTKTFTGAASGVTTPPAATVQTFTGLSGSASSMTYSVPSGGSLSYSYTY